MKSSSASYFNDVTPFERSGILAVAMLLFAAALGFGQSAIQVVPFASPQTLPQVAPQTWPQSVTPPSQPQKPQLGAPGSGKAGEVAPSPAAQGILVFKVRIAFSLNAQMVQTMQSRTNSILDGTTASTMPSASTSVGGSTTSGESPVKDPSWGEALVRNVPPGTAFEVRLVGQTLIVLLQIFPINVSAKGTGLVLQSQVWYQEPGAPLSFKTSVQNINVLYGNTFYFYPLGADSKSGAPVAMEIAVDSTKK